MVGPNAYKLKLPHTSRCHPVFNVSALRAYEKYAIPNRRQPTPPPITDLDGHTRYVVENILSHRRRQNQLQYLVKCFPISSQADRKLCIVVHSIRLDKAPPHLRKYNWFLPTRPTRNPCTLPKARTSAYTRSPFFAAYSLWLALPLSVKSSCTLKDFKANMKLVF